MRTDPERVSLDLIGRKLAECSDEELAALVGAERLLRAGAKGVGVRFGACIGTFEDPDCDRQVGTICKEPGNVCLDCCPEHRCGA